MMRAVGVVIMLAGCAPVVEQETPVRGETGMTCKVGGLNDLVGKVATDALAADVLRRSGARSLRRIAPGAAVTMDYREDRVNIEVDARNRVTRVKCG